MMSRQDRESISARPLVIAALGWRARALAQSLRVTAESAQSLEEESPAMEGGGSGSSRLTYTLPLIMIT